MDRFGFGNNIQYRNKKFIIVYQFEILDYFETLKDTIQYGMKLEIISKEQLGQYSVVLS